MTKRRGRIGLSLVSLVSLALAGCLSLTPASAVEQAKPAPAVPAVTAQPPKAPATAAPSPSTPPAQAATPTPPAEKLTLDLAATLTDDGPAITSGLVWRVFLDNGMTGDEQNLKLVATAAGGNAEFKLDRGTYIVHAAYGRAGKTIKIDLNTPQRSETISLDAGGVKLNALLAGDIAIPADKLTFDVYSRDADSGGERQALVIGAAANTVIRLNADTYQVVSHYGNVNATVRAEVHVSPGKLTEATLYQKAADITLKLVAEPGGEALTNVDWQILTPAGVQVAESEGTFAQMVLAEGDYAVVAKHKDKVYTRNFSVESGYNREIEVQAVKAGEGGPGLPPLK
jgi:hypothetical protein